MSTHEGINVNTTLSNDQVTLRPWKVSDARWYVEARDEEVFTWTTESRSLTIEETVAAIEKLHRQTDSFGFAITDTPTQELLGNIALVLDRQDRRRAEIMYWLCPQGRGRGMATIAVAILSRWGFTALDLVEVTLQTYRGNIRSQRVAERAGFRRDNGLSEGVSGADKVWYSLSR